MFKDVILDLYNKFRIYFYMQVFAKFEKREASLTTVESYSVECIKALGEPTVQEFAIMMGISAPNAAYKVNALMEKGYIEKIQDENDHREFHLRPTKKFWDYYEVSYRYVEKVEERCRQRFSKGDLAELMPELDVMKFTKEGAERHISIGADEETE